jgi:nitroreductase
MKPGAQESILDVAKFAATPLKREPYDYIVVPDFVRGAAFANVVADYPVISKRGSFPLSALEWGPAFAQLLEELQGDAFRQAAAEKFGVDLTGKPTMITVRGMCGTKDGHVHTDTESKILSLLLYMNQSWEENDGGRLRVLRSKNLEDVAEEIPPAQGTLLVFRRSDHSWHGHKPFIGVRRVVQLNWVTEQKFVETNYKRHGFSALLKRLNPFGGEY